jgi:hypothetical protein
VRVARASRAARSVCSTNQQGDNLVTKYLALPLAALALALVGASTGKAAIASALSVPPSLGAEAGVYNSTCVTPYQMRQLAYAPPGYSTFGLTNVAQHHVWFLNSVCQGLRGWVTATASTVTLNEIQALVTLHHEASHLNDGVVKEQTAECDGVYGALLDVNNRFPYSTYKQLDDFAYKQLVNTDERYRPAAYKLRGQCYQTDIFAPTPTYTAPTVPVTPIAPVAPIPPITYPTYPTIPTETMPAFTAPTYTAPTVIQQPYSSPTFDPTTYAPTCPAGTTLSNYLCMSPCPTGTTDLGYGSCQEPCPTGTIPDSGLCRTPCPAGTTLTSSLCMSQSTPRPEIRLQRPMRRGDGAQPMSVSRASTSPDRRR